MSATMEILTLLTLALVIILGLLQERQLWNFHRIIVAQAEIIVMLAEMIEEDSLGAEISKESEDGDTCRSIKFTWKEPSL